MPKPTAQWLSVTSAKAQKAQKTKAWARPGQRALADDFGLAEHFPDEIPDALADGEEMEARVFFRLQNFIEDHAEAAPEAVSRGDDQRGEEQLLREGEVLGFGEGWREKIITGSGTLHGKDTGSAGHASVKRASQTVHCACNCELSGAEVFHIFSLL